MQSRSLPTIVVVLLAGCAASQPSGHLGYGTPGVSAFMPAGQTDDLAAQIARCRAPISAAMAASCVQLRTSMHNQPGNAAGSR